MQCSIHVHILKGCPIFRCTKEYSLPDKSTRGYVNVLVYVGMGSLYRLAFPEGEIFIHAVCV